MNYYFLYFTFSVNVFLLAGLCAAFVMDYKLHKEYKSSLFWHNNVVRILSIFAIIVSTIGQFMNMLNLFQ